MLQKIVPCLWFNGNAEEAMNFYVSIFKEDSRIEDLIRFDGEGSGPQGAVLSGTFVLREQEFLVLNDASPGFRFTEAVSFFVNCKTQEEVDELWEKLSAGGEKGRCGWLKDKYGLSWQIIPSALPEMLQDEDPVKARRVLQAMLEMDKIDIPTLQRAYENC